MNRADGVAIRTVEAFDAPGTEDARKLFRDYASWGEVTPCLNGFAAELDSLPGEYSPPGGRLFVAYGDGQPVGCLALRRQGDGVAELKRLYVDPAWRGIGLARRLVLAAIAAANELGYSRLVLDTLPVMRVARRLYRGLGFAEIAPYAASQPGGHIALALELAGWQPVSGRAVELPQLFDYNRKWAREMTELDSEFFAKLSQQQAPEYLWIGCSDSRVPANQIVGLLPGEVFVHRNIANVVVHTDLNCLSVIQFAIDVLRVKHIMVVGHYGCGGVRAALKRQRVGLADNWLRHVQDVHVRHAGCVDEVADLEARHDLLCELNVIEQVQNVCQTTVVRDAWERGQPLTVHGWIYALRDGLLRDLGFTVVSPDGLEQRYRSVVAAVTTASKGDAP